jgi:hypothetical protein
MPLGSNLKVGEFVYTEFFVANIFDAKEQQQLKALHFGLRVKGKILMCYMSSLYIQETFGLTASDLKAKFEEWLDTSDGKLNTEIRFAKTLNSCKLTLKQWFPKDRFPKAQFIILDFELEETILLQDIRDVKAKAKEAKDEKLEKLCAECEAGIVAGECITDKLALLAKAINRDFSRGPEELRLVNVNLSDSTSATTTSTSATTTSTSLPDVKS